MAAGQCARPVSCRRRAATSNRRPRGAVNASDRRPFACAPRGYKCVHPAAVSRHPFAPPFSPSSQLPRMAGRFTNNGATKIVFGRRTLHVWEAHLLSRATHHAPPSMSMYVLACRLNRGGFPFLLCPSPTSGATRSSLYVLACRSENAASHSGIRTTPLPGRRTSQRGTRGRWRRCRQGPSRQATTPTAGGFEGASPGELSTVS